MNADFHVAIGRVCFRLDRTDGASVAGEGAYPTRWTDEASCSEAESVAGEGAYPTRARAPTPHGEVSGHEASQL